MKFLLIFAILFGFTLANDLFVGSWKEDLYKRKGLGPFLAERGIGWFKRAIVTGSSGWWLTMDIRKNGDNFDVSGKSGYYLTPYSFTLIPDGRTSSDIDLGALGGTRRATATFEGDGNTLKTSLFEGRKLDLLAIRKINPSNPNVMIYTLVDVKSGKKLIQHMDRQ